MLLYTSHRIDIILVGFHVCSTKIRLKINDEFGLCLRRSNPQWKLKITFSRTENIM